jgi:hypothetical protein
MRVHRESAAKPPEKLDGSIVQRRRSPLSIGCQREAAGLTLLRSAEKQIKAAVAVRGVTVTEIQRSNRRIGAEEHAG